MTDFFTETNGKVVRSADGFILLKHYNSNSIPVMIEGDNITYNFSTISTFDHVCHMNDLSCAWINPIHVDKLLSVKAQVCCGKLQPKFQTINLFNANLWAFGNR